MTWLYKVNGGDLESATLKLQIQFNVRVMHTDLQTEAESVY